MQTQGMFDGFSTNRPVKALDFIQSSAKSQISLFKTTVGRLDATPSQSAGTFKNEHVSGIDSLDMPYVTGIEGRNKNINYLSKSTRSTTNLRATGLVQTNQTKVTSSRNRELERQSQTEDLVETRAGTNSVYKSMNFQKIVHSRNSKQRGGMQTAGANARSSEGLLNNDGPGFLKAVRLTTSKPHPNELKNLLSLSELKEFRGTGISRTAKKLQVGKNVVQLKSKQALKKPEIYQVASVAKGIFDSSSMEAPDRQYETRLGILDPTRQTLQYSKNGASQNQGPGYNQVEVRVRGSQKMLNKRWMNKFFIKRKGLSGSRQQKQDRLTSGYAQSYGGSTLSLKGRQEDERTEGYDQQSLSTNLATRNVLNEKNWNFSTKQDNNGSLDNTKLETSKSALGFDTCPRPTTSKARGRLDVDAGKKFRREHREKQEKELLGQIRIFDDLSRPLDDIQKPEDVPEYDKAISLDAGSTTLKRSILPPKKSPWDEEPSFNEASIQSKLKLSELKDLKLPDSPTRKLTIYHKKELEFKKVYAQKLKQLRFEYQQSKIIETTDGAYGSQGKKAAGDSQHQSSTLTDKQSRPKNEEMKFSDINIFQQRNDNYKIISNRIKILARKELRRQYIHKDLKGYESTFDPIRMKLRVMPIERAPKISGKTAEYYFIQAGKLCTRNQLTHAIEELNKGLLIQQNHLLCRFNHGVIMFKLGLLRQAKYDFEMVAKDYPKELTTHFNLALTHLQLGDYLAADKAVECIVSQSKRPVQLTDSFDCNKASAQEGSPNYELLYDTHMLKAQCYWRLNRPLDAVKNFNIAARYGAQQKKSKVDNRSHRELLLQIKDLVYKEMKLDIIEESEWAESRRAGSFHFDKRGEPLSLQGNLRIGGNSGFSRKRQTVNFVDAQGVNQDKAFRAEVATTNQEQMNKIQENEINQQYEQHGSENQRLLDDQPEKPAATQGLTLDVGSQDHSSKPSARQRGNHVKQQLESSAPLLLGTTTIPPATSPLKTQKTMGSSTKNRLSHESQCQLRHLKTKLIERRETAEQVKKIVFNSKAHQFYQQLREEQIKIIDEGFDGKRFDMIYSHLLEPIHAKLNEEYTKMFVLKRPDATPQQLKQKLGELSQILGAQQSRCELTEAERLEIEMRKQVDENEEVISHSATAAQIKVANEKNEQRFMEFMMADDETGKNVKNRLIQGANFSPNGICEINQGQWEVEVAMSELDAKFQEVSRYWTRELEKQDRKIFKKHLRAEDATQFENGALRNKNKHGARRPEVHKKDPLIEQLKEQKNSRGNQPVDICNILQLDLDEKERIRQIRSMNELQHNSRLSQQHIALIRKEFEEHVGSQRAVKVLTAMLKHMKFFVRFTDAERKLIFEQAEYLSLPARTVVFNQGDIGDSMYVILKGRVAVEKKSQEYGNLPIIVALLKDGEHFGELGLIDQDRIDKQTKEVGIVGDFSEKRRYATRKGSCITAEQTELLVLNQQLCNILYQPDRKKIQKPATKTSAPSSDSVSEEQDQLSKKICFLQSLACFADVEAKYLMPIAVNIIPKTYAYGEFIIKKGEVPGGLHIIIEGQCKVVATQLAVRKGGKKAGGPRDRHVSGGIHDPLLQNFDPESSVLNQVNFMERGYQNQRVLIDPHGAEIKGCLQYTDFMVFNHLMRGNYFGGRVLAPFEHYQNTKRLYCGAASLERYYPVGASRKKIDKESDEHYQMKGLLSVVAESAKVEVWIIDKQDMGFLPDKVLKQTYEKLILGKEEDRPFPERDLEFIIEQFQKWDRFKLDCVESLFERNAMQKFMSGK